MISKTLIVAAAAVLSATSAIAGTTVIDFNNGTAPGFTGEFGLFATGVSGVAAAPGSTPFLAVPSASVTSGTAVYTSNSFITSFSFDWGTPDSYNALSFTGLNGTTAPILGNLAPGRYTYTFSAADQIKSVNFSSSNRAFEIDNVSVTAVPEPATWGLMIGGFLMVGFAARRRNGVVAA